MHNVIGRDALFAAVVAVVAIIAAMAVPAWAAFQPEASSSRIGTVSSSAGGRAGPTGGAFRTPLARDVRQWADCLRS